MSNEAGELSITGNAHLFNELKNKARSVINMGLFTITDDIRKLFEKHRSELPDSLQGILIELKKLGYSQVDSIRILMEILSIGLPQANEIVSASKAWNSNTDSL